MAIYINGIKVAGRGQSGKSPYQIAVEGGYTGTEADFNTQLVNIGEATKGFDELKSQVESAKDEVAAAVAQAQNDIATAKIDINNAVIEAQKTVSSAKTDINNTVASAKTEIDEKVQDALAEIPDSENLATKNYVDNAIATIDLSNYYTKTQVDNAISAATASIVTDIWYYGASAPSNTKLLWIDSNSSTGGLKYYNGSSWAHVPVAWS